MKIKQKAIVEMSQGDFNTLTNALFMAKATAEKLNNCIETNTGTTIYKKNMSKSIMRSLNKITFEIERS